MEGDALGMAAGAVGDAVSGIVLREVCRRSDAGWEARLVSGELALGCAEIMGADADTDADADADTDADTGTATDAGTAHGTKKVPF
jgi:hypothetical protein